MGNRTVSFTVCGDTYQVDPDGYAQGYEQGIYFPTRRCPKCKTLNDPREASCRKCSESLVRVAPVLAVSRKRTWLKYSIAATLWGVIAAAFSVFFHVQLGAIPTILILGACYFIGDKCCGERIRCDETATEYYRDYLKKQEAEKETQNPD